MPVQIECDSYALVWVSWRISGKIQFGAGPEIGRNLYFHTVVDNTNCSSVTEWDWGSEIGEDTVQMTLHRSEGIYFILILSIFVIKHYLRMTCDIINLLLTR